MHGRRRVKTATEVAAQRHRERLAKAAAYEKLSAKVVAMNGERVDEAAIALTETLLRANPEMYTAWNMRRRALLKFRLGADDCTSDEREAVLEKELALVVDGFAKNPKSYWLWNHRRWSAEQLPVPNWGREVELCNQFLRLDSRNFHCWDYRRFVSERANASPESEFEFTSTKINDNFSNYSAWHQRSRLLPVVHPSTVDSKTADRADEAALCAEFELVQNAFFTEPDDQSAWFYHRWLLGRARGGLVLLQAEGERARDAAGTVDVRVVVSRTVHSFTASLTVHSGADETQRVQVLPQWHAMGPHRESVLWECTVPCDVAALTAICVSLDNSPSLTLSFSSNVEETTQFVCCTDTIGRDTIALTDATVIEQELESCRQLVELEPESKWPLLTLVHLMHALDPSAHRANLLASLARLCQLDPFRANYYLDMRARFLCEFAAREREQSLSDVGSSLASLSLSRLCCVERFALNAKTFDLSGNQLHSIDSLWALSRLTVLLLDDNLLADLDGFAQLSQLKTLSVCRNQLRSVTGTKGMGQLESIALTGNSRLETDHLVGILRELTGNAELSVVV